MLDPSNVFSEEYNPESSSVTGSVTSRVKLQAELKVDVEKYGVAKPKRKLIKGSILRDDAKSE